MSAHAGLLTVVNPSFETEVLADGTSSTSVVGWSEDVNPNGIFTVHQTVAFNTPVPDGDNFVVLVSSTRLSQVLTDTLTGVAGSRYDLSVFIGDRLTRIFGGYDIRLFAGTTELASIGSTSGGPIPGDGEFVDAALSYVTTGLEAEIGQALKIQIDGRFGGFIGEEISIDHVRLNFKSGGTTPQPVPEPSTMALLSSGLAMLGLCFSRRREAWV